MFNKERFKYYNVMALTLLFFFSILFFGLNLAERNTNQLAGIDTPPRSFCVELDQEENVVLTFAGNRVLLPLPAVMKSCFYPGRLIHTIYLWGNP